MQISSKEYRAIIDKLGLSQRAAARLLGVTEGTSRVWARNGVTGAAAILFTLLAAGDITVNKIAEANGTNARAVRLGKNAE